MAGKIEKLAERKDIPKALTWDLDPLYKKSEAWEADFKKIDPLLKKFNSYAGKLSKSAKTLADALKASDELERLLEKLHVFAHLRSDEDTAVSANRGRLDRISSKAAEIEGETAWFEPEILELPEKTFKAYLKSKELAFYNRSLTELERSRKHMLSEKEERILGMASEVLSSPHKIFSSLNNADLRFPEITDAKGNTIELTHGNYLRFLESHDRKLRKDAFNGMYDTYSKFRNTFAATLDNMVKAHALEAKLRKYPSALEASLHDDNVPVEVYNKLIESIHGGFAPLHKYFKIRAKALKLKKIDMYDIFTPLVPDCKMEFSWKDACATVEKAMKPMGKNYCALVKKAFTDRWVDAMENRGKKSGAYSSGCYDSPPYILMNFNGNLNSVFTLAHEMGHSLHSYHSNQARDYHYADYRIFVAEVASTTAELLLHKYLMANCKDKNVRIYLLCHLADEIRGTVYRQTMFAEYEKMIHEKSEKGIPLTADELSSSYFELNKLYHGASVQPDDKIRMEWARIPHFYYDFYVYKYATGFSAAIQLSEELYSGDSAAAARYKRFLEAGDSKDVLDIMLDAGVDFRSDKPVKSCIKLFTELVNQLEKELFS